MTTEQLVHLHVHTEFSMLDGAARVKELVTEAVQLGMPALAVTDHGVLYGLIDFYTACREAGIKPVLGCLVAGQEVITDSGVNDVEEIKVGDLVLTHRGRFRRVTMTMRRPYNGVAYRVHLAGRYTRPLLLTEEHPILVRGRDGNTTWLKPGQIDAGRYSKHGGVGDWKAWVCLPKLAEAKQTIDFDAVLPQGDGWDTSEDVVRRTYVSKYRADERWAVPARLELDEDVAYLMGIYAAEGWVQERNGALTGSVGMAHDSSEWETTERVAAIVGRFGAKYCVRHRSDAGRQNSLEGYFCCLPLAHMLASLVGRGAENKRVPSLVIQAPRRVREAFVRGLVDGDGATPTLPTNVTNQASVRLTSRDLAWGLRTLLADLGHFVGVRETPPARGRKAIFSVSYTPGRVWAKTLEDDDYVYRPILRIEPVDLETEVFNLEVEEDNSYVSDFVLHNCELYLARESRFAKLPGEDSPKTIQHMTVLARNETGYRNLLHLATAASLEGQYYKPRVDKELLAEHADGLIGTTGCLNGPIPRLLLEGRVDEAHQTARFFRDVFGPENFLIELQAHGIAEQDVVNPHLVEMSSKLGIPMIGTNDLHYTRREDAEAHDVLLCIQTNSTVDEAGRFKFDSQEFYLKSRQQMEAVLGHYPEALDRTVEVAERCNVELTFGDIQLPDFEVPPGVTLDEHLEQLTFEGARRLYGDPIPDEARSRIQYELGVIREMGFSGYFLIVADVMNYARSRGIRSGARGSAAGSCVSYCLRITTLDPLKYKLDFERFLNKERYEMPDVDLDFDERYRGEAIQYLRKKYGDDRVAQVVTFATIKAKSGIRDAARVLGFPYGMGDRLAKMYPAPKFGKEAPIETCFVRSSDPRWAYAYGDAAELRQAYEAEQDARRVLDAARKLEGLRRQTGVHAAAVVVGREPLVNHTALQRTDNGDVVTQYDMNGVTKLGLLKIDCLGLSNFTVIDITCDLVRKRGIEVDIDTVSLDDAAVWKMLSAGDSDGVFQLESDGMRRVLRELKPDRFEDIVALIALYRPGPMAEIPKYIERKHDPSKVLPPHPLMGDILEDTYGVIVYQEQVLQMLQKIAGYTPGEADKVRKALGKKIEAILKAEEPKFLGGAEKLGVSAEQARKLWELIQPFADYSFNRAHSANYALIAYQTAYLKAHYPVEYLSAILTSNSDKKDEKTKYLAVARKIGVKVLPPDLNRSDLFFAPDPTEPDAVRFGLAGIRNVGEAICEQILQARREGGEFKDFFDLCWRVDTSVLNKRIVESLIKAGAFDSLGHPRGGLLEVFESAIEQISGARRKERDGYVSLFDDPAAPGGERTLVGSTLTIPPGDLPKDAMLAYEKEMLGHYVTDHPLLGMQQVLTSQSNASIAALGERQDGQIVTIAGIVNKIGKKLTRKGELMLLLEIEDLEASCEVVVFPAVAEKAGDLIQPDAVLVVKGRVDLRDDQPKVAAMEVVAPDRSILDKPLVVAIEAKACTPRLLEDLKAILVEAPGSTPVLLHLRSTLKTTVLRLPEFSVGMSPALVARLKRLLGEDRVLL